MATDKFSQGYPWTNQARLIVDGKIASFQSYDFNEKDELELLALMAKPEKAWDDKRHRRLLGTLLHYEFLADVENAICVRALA